MSRTYPDSRGLSGVPVGAYAGLALFFLLLFVPTAYTPAKGVLMLLTLAAIGWQALQAGRLLVAPTIVAWTLFTVTVSAFFMLRGSLSGAPGALRVGTVYVVWPIIYTLFVAGIADRRVLRALPRVMVAATIAIGAYTLSFVLHTLGLLPTALYVPLDQGQAIGIYAGFVELNLYAISSLLFLVPYVVACLLTWPRRAALPVSRGWLWVALAAGMLVVVLSGRRALLLIVVLAPGFAIALRPFLDAGVRSANRVLLLRSIAAVLLGAVAAGVYLATLGITPVGIFDMFMEGFDFAGTESAVMRRLQLWSLLAGWAEQPLLGAGHGAVASVVRSVDMPWAYELSYVALLFHVGALGFLAYAAGVVWIAVTGVRIIRASADSAVHMLPALVGMTCFLVGNATNPYLAKFDYLWVLFLPIAVINAHLIRHGRAG